MAPVNSRAAKPLAAAAVAQLESDGVATLIGTVVSPAGLTHAKTIPLRKMGAFADPGLGASPVWHAFTIDQTGIAVGGDLGVVGDKRIRIDLAALRILGDGLAWAPGAFYDQDGEPDPYCSRGALARIESRLADAGFTALVGHEMEFLLVGPDGSRLPADLWAQYGLAGVLEYEGFVRDVTDAATSSGVSVEQFHPEYGVNQFEISLTPQSPVARRRPADADQDDRRQGRQATRRTGQPVAGTLRRECRFWCASTLFTAEERQVAVLGRIRRPGNDAGGGV